MRITILAGAAALLTAFAGGWGCQSYERRPLDLETHRREEVNEEEEGSQGSNAQLDRHIRFPLRDPV